MALGSQPVGKLLDFEQYIEHQIHRTRSRIKMTDVLTAALGLATVALGVLFLEVVLDHIVGLPLGLRRVILWGGLLGGGVFAGLRIALPLLSRVNGLYAAKMIEDADPAIKNSLINYLDLRRRREGVSRSFLAAIEARAVKDLTGVEIDTVVNQRRFLQMWYALSGVVVVFCLYAALAPKSILDSARRALLADVVRPTNTRFLNVKPGDFPELARVVSGANVPFSVDIQGTHPGRVKLRYSVDGGKYYATAEFAAGSNFYDPWQTTLRDVRQSLDYYLTGGDAESLKYHLEVVAAPMVTAVTKDYEFPAYTGVPPRKGVEGGSIEAIEGTKVTVEARTNEPAVSAYFDFSKDKDNKNPPMEVAGADGRLLVGSFTVKESGTYTIKFKTTGGQVNPDPVVYDVVAIPDRAPTEVAFLRPDKPEISVPANVRVPLVMTAADDFGVKDALLSVRQGNETLYSVNLLEKEKPTRRFKGTFTIDLSDKRVKPGTQVEYWLTVRDTKEPVSNRAETPRQVIKVTEPVKETDRKALEQRAEKEKTEAENQAPPEPEADAENPAPVNPPKSRGEQDPAARGPQDKPGPAANPAGAAEKDRGEVDPHADPAGKDDPPKLTAEQLAKLEKALQKANPRNGVPPQSPRGASEAGNPGADRSGNPEPGGPKETAADRPGGPSESAAKGSAPGRSDPNPATAPGATPPNPSGAQGAGNGPESISRAGQPPNPDRNARPDPGSSPPGPSPAGNPGAPPPSSAAVGSPNSPRDATGAGNPSPSPAANPGPTPQPPTPAQTPASGDKGKAPRDQGGKDGQKADGAAERVPNETGAGNPGGLEQTKDNHPAKPPGPQGAQDRQGPTSDATRPPGAPNAGKTPSGTNPDSNRPGEPRPSEASKSDAADGSRGTKKPEDTAPSPAAGKRSTDSQNPSRPSGPTETTPTGREKKSGAESPTPGGTTQSDPKNAKSGAPGSREENSQGDASGRKPEGSKADQAKEKGEGGSSSAASNANTATNPAPRRPLDRPDPSKMNEPGGNRPTPKAGDPGTPKGVAGDKDSTPKPAGDPGTPKGGVGEKDSTRKQGGDPTTRGDEKAQDKGASESGTKTPASADAGKGQDASDPKKGQPPGAGKAGDKGKDSQAKDGQTGKKTETANKTEGPSGASKPGEAAPQAGQGAPKTQGADQNASGDRPGEPSPSNRPGGTNSAGNPKTQGEGSPSAKPGENSQGQPSASSTDPTTAEGGKNGVKSDTNPTQSPETSANEKPAQGRPGAQTPSNKAPNSPDQAQPGTPGQPGANPRPLAGDPNASGRPRPDPNSQPGNPSGADSLTKDQGPGTSKDEAGPAGPKSAENSGGRPAKTAGKAGDAEKGGDKTRSNGSPPQSGSPAQSGRPENQPGMKDGEQTPESRSETQAEARNGQGESSTSRESAKGDRAEPLTAKGQDQAGRPQAGSNPTPKMDDARKQAETRPERSDDPRQAPPEATHDNTTAPPEGGQPSDAGEPKPGAKAGGTEPGRNGSGAPTGKQGAPSNRTGTKPGGGSAPGNPSSAPPGGTPSGEPARGNSTNPGGKTGNPRPAATPDAQARGKGEGGRGGPPTKGEPGASGKTPTAGKDGRPQEGSPSSAAPGQSSTPGGAPGRPGEGPAKSGANPPGGANSPPAKPSGGGDQSGRKGGPPSGSPAGPPGGKGGPAGPSDGATPGGAGRDGRGGGGKNPGGGGPVPEDKSERTPRAAAVRENAADNVAPRNQPQSDLVLRQLRDLIKNDKVTPEMEKDLGMSKEELNQFVKRFEKAPKSEPGAGREIDVKPGKAADLDPKRTLPDLNPNTTISTKQMREHGTFVQDNVRGNVEGGRFEPPPELRAGVNAYRKSLSNSRTLNPVRRPAGGGSGSGGK